MADDEPEIIPPEKKTNIAEVEQEKYLPDIPLPPSGIFRIAIIAVAKFGGVRKAFESYERALAAKRDALAAAAGMYDAKGAMERSLARLDDLQTILDTDQDIRTYEREDAENRLNLGKLRHEREWLEEETEILRLQREKAHLDGEEGTPSDDEYNEVIAAFKKELGSFKSEKEIRKLAEEEIAKILQGRGEAELTEEEQLQISRIRKFVETYLETLK